MLTEKRQYQLRRFLQHGRIGIGVIGLTVPGLLLLLLGIERKNSTRMLMRLFGSREIALGAGALIGEKARSELLWFRLGVVVDFLDAALFSAGFASGKISRPRALLFSSLSLGSALAGALVVFADRNQVSSEVSTVEHGENTVRARMPL